MSIEIEAAVEAEAVELDNNKSAEPSQALAIIVPTAIVRPAAASAMLVPKLIGDAGENASLRFLDFFTAYSVSGCAFFAWLDAKNVAPLATVRTHSSRRIPTLTYSEWGMRFCFLCKTRTRARRISDRRSVTTLLPPRYRASSRSSSAATSSFCPLATTRSASSGSARFWKPKRSFVVSPSLTFRTDVHRVQMPAKKASGRLSSNANHTGGRETVRQTLVLSEAGKGDDAATYDAEPSPPVGRFDVADVGDARICLLACDGEGRRRHAPARHRELAHAIPSGADDRRGVVGEDARQHRQVAREVAHGAGEVADGLLAFGDAGEIAHGAQRLTVGWATQGAARVLSSRK